MMTVFKILMILVAVISFMGSVVENSKDRQKMQVAMFGISGGLLLLAVIADKVL